MYVVKKSICGEGHPAVETAICPSIWVRMSSLMSQARGEEAVAQMAWAAERNLVRWFFRLTGLQPVTIESNYH